MYIFINKWFYFWISVPIYLNARKYVIYTAEINFYIFRILVIILLEHLKLIYREGNRDEKVCI